MKAEIKLTRKELEDVIKAYTKQRTSYVATDVNFKLKERTEGDQRDNWKVTELTEVVITIDLPSNIV